MHVRKNMFHHEFDCGALYAAIGNVGFDNKKALFGVFDGHGGSEVAKYTKKYLEDIIRDTNEYKDRDYC